MEPDQIQQEAERIATEAIEEVRRIPWAKIIMGVVIVIGTLALVIFAYKTYSHRPVINQPAGPVVAQEAPQAASVPKTFIPGPKKLQVYDKAKLAEKIPLPPEVKDNPQVQPTATAAITPSPYGGTAVAYTNMTTGKSGISYQPKPRPWFEFGGQTAIGAGVGVSTMGGQVGAVRIRQDVLRLWSATLSAEGEGNIHTTGQVEGRAMVWAEKRW